MAVTASQIKSLFSVTSAEVMYDEMLAAGFTDLQIRLHTGCPADYYYRMKKARNK